MKHGTLRIYQILHYLRDHMVPHTCLRQPRRCLTAGSRRELRPAEGDAHAAAGGGQVRVVDGVSPVEAHVARLDLQRAARQLDAHGRPLVLLDPRFGLGSILLALLGRCSLAVAEIAGLLLPTAVTQLGLSGVSQDRESLGRPSGSVSSRRTCTSPSHSHAPSRGVEWCFEGCGPCPLHFPPVVRIAWFRSRSHAFAAELSVWDVARVDDTRAIVAGVGL